MRALANVDEKTVEGFGDEWSRFRYDHLNGSELQDMFRAYFDIFPFEALPPAAVGADFGCGSGRWARLVAPRVGTLHCVDASRAALSVAEQNLRGQANCVFHCASVDSVPLLNQSLDFGYSLGVLHHVPDTAAALRACVEKLKLGAPFLLYLYYAFDNRPSWYRALWLISELARKTVSSAPQSLRYGLSQLLAAGIYFPLAKIAWLLEWMGRNIDKFPLSAYRKRSFYVMRTDALDRFGTPLEQRFTREQIKEMMENAGLMDIKFSPHLPFWVSLGHRRW